MASLNKNIVHHSLFKCDINFIYEGMKVANFKDSIVKDGTTLGAGKSLGNIKDGIIKNGGSRGAGSALGNVKGDIIKDGTSRGAGKALLNVKNGIVKDGGSLGAGKIIGKVGDYKINGVERELDSEIVAMYHFLIKKLV